MADQPLLVLEDDYIVTLPTLQNTNTHSAQAWGGPGKQYLDEEYQLSDEETRESLDNLENCRYFSSCFNFKKMFFLLFMWEGSSPCFIFFHWISTRPPSCFRKNNTFVAASVFPPIKNVWSKKRERRCAKKKALWQILRFFWPSKWGERQCISHYQCEFSVAHASGNAIVQHIK